VEAAVTGIELAMALAALLAMSALFSGTETALFSIPPLRLQEMRASESPAERAVAHAMEHPRRILITILVGNLVVNILASALGAGAAIRWTGSAGWGVVIATLVMTFLILVLGEIAPKTLAYRHAEPIARLAARPFLVLGTILTPVRWPLLKLTNLVLGREAKLDERVEMEEVHAMLRLAHAEGEVETHERDLIRGVMELGSSPVESVMTPRTEIFSLPAEMPVVEARRRAHQARFSKIPVRAGRDPDEMAGVVTALDLLLAPDDATLGKLVHEAVWVPEVKPAIELLEEFQSTGRRLVFAVDEHGHLSGLVTLTDLLEEISGEMIERIDLHKVLYRRVDKNRVIIPARMEIRFFNEEFGTELEAEESETMGGLLLERCGRIPSQGEEFRMDGVTLRVVKAEPNRIVTIEVELAAAGKRP
jgi:putative hemolysin